MDKVNEAANHVFNPGQTPVMAFDQLLFVFGKQIQQEWPDL